MEEKERYELNDNDCIIDNEKDVAICDVCDVSESPETLVDLLNQQDKRIKELEQDKTKFMDLLNSMTENWWVSYEKNKKLRQENKQLKQQIAEKDEEIEELNDKLKWKSKWLKTADNMVGHYEKSNQDKISFALEQLEKVKENIKKVTITDYDLSGNFEKMYKRDAIRQIDNQIKQLKEMK